jgi:hypothetical protein
LDTVQFKCVSCGFEKAIPSQYAGKRVRCPRCQAENLVPGTPGPQGMSVPPAGRTAAPSPAHATPAAAASPDLIKFHCPLCNQKISVGIQHAGRQLRCPKCKAVVAIPAAPKHEPPRAEPIGLTPSVGDAPHAKPSRGLDEPGISFERPFVRPQDSGSGLSPYPVLIDTPVARAGRATTNLRPPNRKRRVFALSIIGGAYLLALLLAAGAAAIFYQGRPKDSVVDVEPAKDTAMRFVTLLEAGNTLGAGELTSTELHGQLNEKEMARLISFVRAANGFTYQEEQHCIREKSGQLGVVLTYKPSSPMQTEPGSGSTEPNAGESVAGGESAAAAAETAESSPPADGSAEPNAAQTDEPNRGSAATEELDEEDLELGPSLILTLVEAEKGKFVIEGVTAMGANLKQSVSASSKVGDEISVRATLAPLMAMGTWVVKFAGLCTAAALLVIGVMVACTWVIFSKAGEPGWAAIVPFYGPWVLAEVAGKPGWWGLVLAMSVTLTSCGCYRYVTSIAVLALAMMICIGLAKTFQKSPLFGVGLCLLAPIYFPILAFWDE